MYRVASGPACIFPEKVLLRIFPQGLLKYNLELWLFRPASWMLTLPKLSNMFHRFFADLLLVWINSKVSVKWFCARWLCLFVAGDIMHCRRVSELAGGYVVNDLLCMLEQPYLRRNFVDDIVRLLLDIVKDTKSQVQPVPVLFWASWIRSWIFI